MSLSLRAAAPSDAGVIFALIGELAAYEKLTHEVEAHEADIAAALFGPAPRAFCEIAEWDGAPVGIALWFYTFSTFRGRHGLYLEDLFVRPEARGKGVGKALVARLAARCRDERLGRLEWAVLDWNAPSIAFYDGLGARPTAGWTGYRLDGGALGDLAATA